MKIKVTDKHIKNGNRCNWSSCPVALALREVSGTRRIAVNSAVIYVGTTRFEIPKKVLTFIKRFDAGENVSPFTFEVDL